jgi:Holliday junction resolvasome RuvABC endonuclease subunit
MRVLAFDPSGSFNHGSGTTGWCVVEVETNHIVGLGNIKAKDFKTREEYFKKHKDIMKQYIYDILVIENFILYESTASSLLNQELETSELIGFICGVANERNKKVVRQNAQAVKSVLKKNSILLSVANQKENQIELRSNKLDRVQWYFDKVRISNHIVDSLRHAFYYINQEKKNDSTRN